MSILQQVVKKVSILTRSLISFIQGFLNAGINLTEFTEENPGWQFFSLKNLVLAILVAYLLDWTFAVLRSTTRVILKISRWILAFCIVVKVIFDVLSGRAFFKYNFENFKQAILATISELRELFSSTSGRTGTVA